MYQAYSGLISESVRPDRPLTEVIAHYLCLSAVNGSSAWVWLRDCIFCSLLCQGLKPPYALLHSNEAKAGKVILVPMSVEALLSQPYSLHLATISETQPRTSRACSLSLCSSQVLSDCTSVCNMSAIPHLKREPTLSKNTFLLLWFLKAGGAVLKDSLQFYFFCLWKWIFY